MRFRWWMGATRQLGDTASKARLGSGEANPVTFHATLAPRDVVVLASDGLWTALGHAGIDRVVRGATLKPAPDLPGALLDAVRGPLADDATVVALRYGGSR